MRLFSHAHEIVSVRHSFSRKFFNLFLAIVQCGFKSNNPRINSIHFLVHRLLAVLVAMLATY
jgi:hypothetical protein